MHDADDDPVILRLRTTGHAEHGQAPPVDAFCGPGRRAGTQDAAVIGRGQAERDSVVVFFRHAAFGIPPLSLTAVAETEPDFESWRLRPTVFGYLAEVPRTGVRAPSRARVAWVVAAGLSLVAPVHAQAMVAPAPVQRPKTVVPNAPKETEEGKPDPSETATEDPADPVTEDPATDGGDDEPTPPTLPEATEDTDGTDEPEASAEAPPPAPNTANMADPFGLDATTRDAAWQGVDGFDVVVVLKGGSKVRGRVGAVQRETFTLIEHETGIIRVLPKSGVRALRVWTPPPVPVNNGTGLLVGGGILTGIGTPVFVSGVAFLAVCPSCIGLHLTLLVLGGGALAGGIPMLVKGTRQRRAYREAVEKRNLMPVVSRSRYAWTGGVRFRF